MVDRRSHVPIVGLFVGSGISLLGTVMTLVAIPWFVLQTTGSAARTGLATAIWILPVVLAGFFGGPIVDRIGYRRAIIVGDVVGGIAIGSIPLLHTTVGLAYWQLLILVFVRGLFDIPGRTARRAILPDVAQLAGMPLERANSTFIVIRDLGSLAGPALAGVLIALIDAENVLWIDAATYFTSAAIATVAIPGSAQVSAADERDTSYVSELIEGLRFVRGHHLILTLLVTSTIVSFLNEPLFGLVLPVFSDLVFGSAVNLGLILSGFGAGSLAGTLLFGAIGHRMPRRPLMIGAVLAMGLPFFVLATFPSFPVAFGVVALVGFISAPFTILYATLLQEQVPTGMRGRVFGLDTTVGVLGMPLGVASVGLLIEWIGIQMPLIFQGVVFVLLAIFLIVHPALRRLSENMPNRPQPQSK